MTNVTEISIKIAFVIAFDSGAKGERYIREDGFSCSYSEDAMQFTTKEEAQSYIDTNNLIADVQEIDIVI